MFNWQKQKKPIIALAPMADYTDEPFSLICKKFGVDVIWREMLSAEALARGSEKTLKMAKINKKERPVILQIFGKDPKTMAEAAKLLEKKFKPDGIDINMGCPAKKIVSDFNGASLMKNTALAAEIIKTVKAAIKVPVSVKTRLGWKDKKEILKFSKIIEKAGADLLTIHGRTKEQGYSGKADWEIIGQVKKQLKIPVILNGDITSSKDASRALELTGCDGIMIGRGALGQPWIFQEMKALWRHRADKKNPPKEISTAERKKIILEHARLHEKRYGKKSMVTFRKHLLFYFRGLPAAKTIRKKLVEVKNMDELKEVLKKI